MFRFDNEYEVKKMGTDLMDHLVFTAESRYQGLEIQYGKVELIEESDALRLKFEFEVFANPLKHDVASRRLNEYLGRVLQDIMEQEFTYAQATKGK
jgi:hypothetical protein